MQTNSAHVVRREIHNLLCDRPAPRVRPLLNLVLDQREFDEFQSPNLRLSFEQTIRLIPTKQLGISFNISAT